MSKTQCLIVLIKSGPSTALPISLHSNSIILLAEAKILTSLLHSSLILIVFFYPIYQEILWTLPSKYIVNSSTSYHFHWDYSGTGSPHHPSYSGSQLSSQGDTRKCKSSYVLCSKHSSGSPFLSWRKPNIFTVIHKDL